ncbi:hypothetical protein MalM25_21010 [Planctomycetes bacterium MalM25]|nr:hypothetical protein MalM25_21010 [Planctomycetes bacterium MalM25]
MSPEWVSAISAVVTALTAIFGVALGISQFSKANQSLKLNSLGVLLNLECELNRCKQLVNEATKELKVETDPARKEALQSSFDQLREDWYNTADRLAYCKHR